MLLYFCFAHKQHHHHHHEHHHHEHGHDHHEHHHHEEPEKYSETTRWYFALLSAFGVSLLSFSGAIFLVLGLSRSKYQAQIKLFLASLAIGSLLGDTCLHLIPTIYGAHSHGPETHASVDSSWYGLCMVIGFLVCFLLEYYLRSKEESSGHHSHSHAGIKPFGWLNLFGDGIHNFMDGVSMASTYHSSFKLGLANTICIVFHEIPQELSDFGVLLSAGFSMQRALLFNFLSGLICVLGSVSVKFLLGTFATDNKILLSLTAGTFIYISAADMIPELWHQLEDIQTAAKKKEQATKGLLLWVLTGVTVGIVIMLFLGRIEHVVMEWTGQHHHHH
jgi:zinc transporter ZupT